MLRNSTSQRLAPWQIEKILRHIEDNLAEAVAVSSLAELAGLSVGYFSRAFRGSFSNSPHAFILNRRLERARLLMLNSSCGLTEIALECGFSDQPHLTKRFRRAVGVSPAVWRKSQHRNPDTAREEYARLQRLAA